MRLLVCGDEDATGIDMDWPALPAAPNLADGRQTNPNAVSGNHTVPFAAHSAPPPVAKDPLVVRMR